MDVRLPAKFKPLIEPHRYKVLYGGRDAAKSWTVARILLLRGLEQKLLILCTREVQNTIAESVHRLLKNQIEELGLGYFYDVQENRIIGDNGTEFMFAGLHQQTADNLKSYEGVSIVWVEEAHKVVKSSWNVLIHTIRKEGSEIWVTFNPDMDSDDTYVRFVVNKPPDCVRIFATWRDSPFRSKVLDQEREHLERTDPDEYAHIYEGRVNTLVKGAIYAKEVTKLIEEGRFGRSPVDPRLKVHGIWDMGWNDAMTVILAQRRSSEVRIVGYIEDNHRTVTSIALELRAMDYNWGRMWLPHDAGHTSRQTAKTDEKLIQEVGFKTKVGRAQDPEDGIRLARVMFPRVYIDDTDLELKPEQTGYRGPKRLMECLKRYRRAVPRTTNEPAGPMHDEFSHGADAFRGLATVIEELTNDEVRRAPITEVERQAVPGVM